MKKICLLLAVLMLLVLSCNVALAAEPNNIKESVARVYVECVESYYEASTQQYIGTWEGSGHGTAFAVGKPGEPVKYFVTNAHVAPGDGTYTDTITTTDPETGVQSSVPVIVQADYTYYLIFSDITTKVPVEFVDVSDRADLSLLMLMKPTKERQAVKIRSVDTLKSSEALWACGFPGVAEQENEGQYYSGYDQMWLLDGKAGTIKDHAITQCGQLLLHTIPTSGGNSGSPVVDKSGNVVGVHSHTYNDDGEHSDFKGAVSSDELMRFLDLEGVEYATAGDGIDTIILIGLAVAAVLVIVVAALLVSRKNGGKASNKYFELVGTAGAHTGKSYTITAEPTLLGRNTSKCRIAYGVDIRGVSALHCEVKAVAGGVQVTDLNSSYGTWIDMVKLRANIPVVMQPGQTLTLGSKQQSFMLRK